MKKYEIELFPVKSTEQFQSPPTSFVDSEGAEIRVKELEETDLDGLKEMYIDFDPADRAQGLPPIREEGISNWLDHLSQGLNIIGTHDGSVIGHVTLMPENNANELAIFVHQDYQGRGIGGKLIEAMLAKACEEDILNIWLTVERWNRPAIALYRKFGFEDLRPECFEKEMGLRLKC